MAEWYGSSMAFDAEALASYYSDRAALRQLAENPKAVAARRLLCESLVQAFKVAGDRLRLGGHLFGSGRVDGTYPFGNGDDGMVALGYLSTTCASLISGAADLLEGGNCYAAAALNRQLVELEYLSWAFAEDHAEAASWLSSSRSDRLDRWQPRHLRMRSDGRFRGSDYAEHCDIGGHPTPEGVRVLRADHLPRVGEIMFRETAHHGLSCWEYLQVAVSQLHGYEETWLIPAMIDEGVRAAAEDWKAQDHLGPIWMAMKDVAKPQG
jgi:hypothetical protein